MAFETQSYSNDIEQEEFDDRSGHIITPEMEGAEGDGVADDTSSVQSAINEVQSSNKVLVMRGEYRITSALEITGEITINLLGTISSDHSGNAVEIDGDFVSIFGYEIGLIVRNGTSVGNRTGSGIAFTNSSSFVSNVVFDGVSVKGFEYGYDFSQQSISAGILSWHGGEIQSNDYAVYGNDTGQINIMSWHNVRCYQNESGGWNSMKVHGATFGASDAEGQPNPFDFTQVRHSEFGPQWFESSNGGDGYGIRIRGGYGIKIGPQRGHTSVDKALVYLEDVVDAKVAGPAILKNCTNVITERQTKQAGRWSYNITDGDDDQYFFGWCDQLTDKGDSSTQIVRQLDPNNGLSYVEHDFHDSNKSVTDGYMTIDSTPVNEFVAWDDPSGDGGRIGAEGYSPTVGNIIVYTIPCRLVGNGDDFQSVNSQILLEFLDSGGSVIRRIGSRAGINGVSTNLWLRHVGRWSYICMAGVVPANTDRINVEVRPDAAEGDNDGGPTFQFGQAVIKEVPPTNDNIAEDIVPDLGAGLVQPQGSSSVRPTGPSKGSRYYDTTLDQLLTWNGSNWIDGSGIVVSDHETDLYELDPFAYWPLDDKSDDAREEINLFTAIEQSGPISRIDGPLADKNHLSPEYDGSADYHEATTLGDFGSHFGSGGGSFSMWLKSSYTADWHCPFGFRAGTNQGLEVQINRDPDGLSAAAGKMRIWFRDENADAINRYGVDTNTGISDGNWHHLFVSLHPVNGTMAIWVDGVEQTVLQNDDENPSNFIDFDYNFVIGARNNQGTIERHFQGAISHLALFKTEITDDTTVTALYNAGT